MTIVSVEVEARAILPIYPETGAMIVKPIHNLEADASEY